MAEGGQQTNIYHITAGTVNFNALQDIRNMNITESYIHSIQSSVNNESSIEPKFTVEVDSGTQNNATRNATVNSTAREHDVKHQQPEQPSKQPTDAPSGPGWVPLSENIYLNNKQPLKKAIYTVYKGKQRVGGVWRDVAIKLIPYDEDNYKEIKLHLKLENHPNIVRIYDAGELQGVTPQIYIVMELCSQTLRDFIEDNKTKLFDFEQRFSFAKQIVKGVAFIHKNHILHRDIKLENILITACNDYVRVADFGLGKQLEIGHSIASVSTRGLGTDGYRAPEMLHEKPQASFRSDSFSLGIVLAMLFSNGHHPFGSDPVRWRTNILDHKGLDLSAILEFDEPHTEKRNQLLDLIRKALNPTARARPTPKSMLDHPFFTLATVRPTRTTTSPRRIESDSVTRQTSHESGPHNAADEFTAKPVAQSQKSLEEQQQIVDAACNYQVVDDARIQFVQGELRKPLKEVGYEKSVQLLEELRILRGSDDLDILLQLAECHLHLMSDKKDSSIANVSKFLGERSSENVREIAETLHEKKQYLQAMILHKVSDDLRKNEEQLSPDDEVDWIRDRVVDIYSAIQPLTKESGRSRDIIEQYGLKYMHEMLGDLRRVQNASLEVRALNELECLVNIGTVYDDIGKSERSIALGEVAVTMMQRDLGERVQNYQRYGQLLNNLGKVYEYSGQYEEAEHRYIEAVEVMETALDHEDEKEREREIAKTNRNLEATRRNLKEYYN